MRRYTLTRFTSLEDVVSDVLPGFSYNQTISYTACDQEVYQQDIVVHRTTGTPYEETVGGLNLWHIFVGNRCKEDYGDIRFTDEAGQELAYYLWPDYDSSSARFAVRLEGATSAGTVTIWYGNPAAATTSDVSVIPARFTEVGDHAYTVPGGIASVSVLVVAGGGASGKCTSWGAGGGGAGGLIFRESYPVTEGEQILVRVGAGGAAGGVSGASGGNGGNSTFGDLIAVGGGGGGGGAGGEVAKSGGSGGGGGFLNDFGAGTPGQGHDGGRSNNRAGGGGGGAGGPGNDAVSTSLGGAGGPGLRIWGDIYAVGGSGVFAAAAEGGSAGGAPGSPNTGNGGGAATGQVITGLGGSGIVIVSIGAPWSATPPAALTFSGEQEAPPAADFTALPLTGPAPLLVQFTDLSVGNPTAWAWDVETDGIINYTDQHPAHLYTLNGAYTVTLTVSNASSSDTIIKTDYIIVGNAPSDPEIAVPYTKTLLDTPLEFTATANEANSFSWDFGDGTTAEGQTVTKSFATEGTYTVTMTATNDFGSVTAQTEIVAYPNILHANVTNLEMINVSLPVQNAPIIVSFKGKLWAISSNYTYSNAVWWSEDGTTWTQCSNVPWAARTSPGIVVHNDKLWLIGGCTGTNDYPSEVWWSPDGMTWNRATATAPWAGRGKMGVLSYENKIWIIGGYNSTFFYHDQKTRSDVWWSEDGATWYCATSSAGFGHRYAIGAFVYDNKIWVAGGIFPESNTYYYNDLWFSEDGTSWTRKTYCPWEKRYYLNTFTHDDKIWVAAGTGAYSAGHTPIYKDIWQSTDSGITWARITNALPLPNTEYIYGGSILPHNNKIYCIFSQQYYGKQVWGTVYGDEAIKQIGVMINDEPIEITTPLAYYHPSTYMWDFGDGTYETGSPITHTYDKLGTYTVTLTIPDEVNGLPTIYTKEITIQKNPTPNYKGHGASMSTPFIK